MTTSARLVALSALGGAYLCVGIPTSAHAGGFSTARFGGEHGHAASDHVTTIYYNPAGLALGKGTRIYVEGTLAYRTVDYDRAEGTIDRPGTGTPDDAIAANAGPARLRNVLASPFAGAATDAGVDGLGLGIGLYVPFGGQAKWDKNRQYEGHPDYHGAVDGPQRWANIEGAQRTVYLTAGGAWASPDRSVAFGVGLNAVMTDLSLVRARNPTGTDDVLGEGRSLLEGSDLTFSVGIGASWAPSPRARIGASYQSQPGFGEMTIEGTLENRFGAGETKEDVVLLQRMPDVVRIAAEIEATPELVIRLGADWQRWSAYDSQCLLPANDARMSCTFNPDGSIDVAAGGSTGVIVNLPRDWKDTFGAKAGAGYRVSPDLEVGGSLSFDSNAVPARSMDPSLFDMNKLIAQAGADYRLGKLSLSATLGQVVYFTRETNPRRVDPMPPSRNPDMAGRYASSVTYLLVGVGANL
jgi:long-chain fatty acid transport protein